MTPTNLGAAAHRNFMPGELCPSCGEETVLGMDLERQCYECGHAWTSEDWREGDE